MNKLELLPSSDSDTGRNRCELGIVRETFSIYIYYIPPALVLDLQFLYQPFELSLGFGREKSLSGVKDHGEVWKAEDVVHDGSGLRGLTFELTGVLRRLAFG